MLTITINLKVAATVIAGVISILAFVIVRHVEKTYYYFLFLHLLGVVAFATILAYCGYWYANVPLGAYFIYGILDLVKALDNKTKEYDELHKKMFGY